MAVEVECWVISRPNAPRAKPGDAQRAGERAAHSAYW